MNLKESLLNDEGETLLIVEKVKKAYFPKLSLAFRGLAPKPPQSLCSLRGLGRLADPQER